MLLIQKPERYSAFLPPTPVTQEMRDQVEALAVREKVSKAHIMRLALAFFLSQDVKYSDIDGQLIVHVKGAEPEQA